MNNRIVGAVLAGGKSRRMGQNKALLPFHGKPLIQHTTELMQKIFSQVLVVCWNRRQYKFLEIPTIVDKIPNCGPLGGIHTALSEVNNRPVFVLACDLPFVTQALIRYIVDFPVHTDFNTTGSENFNEMPLVKIPSCKKRLQPLVGLYYPDVLPIIEQRLIQHQLQIKYFLQDIAAIEVPITSQQSFYNDHLFCNINTPQNYQRTVVDKDLT